MNKEKSKKIPYSVRLDVDDIKTMKFLCKLNGKSQTNMIQSIIGNGMQGMIEVNPTMNTIIDDYIIVKCEKNKYYLLGTNDKVSFIETYQSIVSKYENVSIVQFDRTVDKIYAMFDLISKVSKYYLNPNETGKFTFEYGMEIYKEAQIFGAYNNSIDSNYNECLNYDYYKNLNTNKNKEV